MNAANLLSDLRRRGVEFMADGDTLRFRPKSAADGPTRRALSTHKAALLALLRAEAETQEGQALLKARRAAAGIPPGVNDSDLLDAVLEQFPGARCVRVQNEVA